MKEQKVWVVQCDGVLVDVYFSEQAAKSSLGLEFAYPGSVSEATLLIEEDPEWLIFFLNDGSVTILPGGAARWANALDESSFVVRAKDAQSALAAALKLREGK